MTAWRTPAALPAGVDRLAHRLTDCDWRIIDVLGRHKVLTLDQLTCLFFDSRSSARDRVWTLLELGVLRRFRTGTRAAYRYTLSHSGRCLYVAAGNDETTKFPTKPASEQAFQRLIANSHRAHLEAANDFFCRLYAAARHQDDLQVIEWLSEREAAARCGDMIRPDGGATVAISDREIAFWFEHDTGTEPLHRLAAKLHRYSKSPLADHLPVLFQLPGATREVNLHEHLANKRFSMTVATTTIDLAADPTTAIWRPLHGPPRRRRRLRELPRTRRPIP